MVKKGLGDARSELDFIGVDEHWLLKLRNDTFRTGTLGGHSDGP